MLKTKEIYLTKGQISDKTMKLFKNSLGASEKAFLLRFLLFHRSVARLCSFKKAQWKQKFNFNKLSSQLLNSFYRIIR